MMGVLEPRGSHRSGAAWMVGGAVLVFGSLILMNASVERPERTTEARPVEMTVVKQPPPRKEPVKREVKRPPRPQKSPTPPPVDLRLDLAGLDLGLAAFLPNQVGQVDQKLLGDTEGVVMTADMVDVAPRVTHQTPLEYPARAKAKELEGRVVLSLLIGKDGNVARVKVLEADPPGIFEQSAERTVRQWRFEPARYKGDPVETWANQTIRFSLG